MEKNRIRFVNEVRNQLDRALLNEKEIDEVVDIFTDTIVNDGVIHVFGCGHSQMFGEELCFRTGGLACINAIKIGHYNIYPKAKLSQVMERMEGFAPAVLDTMVTSSNDTMLIVSVSGRNAAGIDMAIAAKEKGMRVIGLTSLTYSENVSSRHSSGKLLKDVCDVVLDLCGIKGDAVLEDDRLPERFCSPSTVVGMSLLVGIVGDVIGALLDRGIEPPIWVSGNLDEGDALNKKHEERYKHRVVIV